MGAYTGGHGAAMPSEFHELVPEGRAVDSAVDASSGLSLCLLELSEMPRRGIDPGWLERLEEEDLTFTGQPRSCN